MAQDRKKNPYAKYLHLTSIAFQMMAIMFVFIWLGQKADEKWNTSQTNYYTLLGTLTGLGVSLYIILQQLKRINK
ncbi:AtpZ/AtpI family protein [Moheibacter sp.]|uniref:AtpZ/AtpI family protein n=1 Tax=Moheibacter sp. TaxID=1965316 RepID=UPI003C7485B0